MPERHVLNLTRLGWGLAIPVLFLASIGLATIHATDRDSLAAAPHGTAASATATTTGMSWFVRLRTAIGDNTAKQAFFLVTGALLLLAMLIPSYFVIGRSAYVIYGVVVFLLALLAIDRHPAINLPFVPVIRDTRRWIEIAGIGIQPSEYMKVALILALARYLRYAENLREWRGLIVPFLMTLTPMGLIYFQPDLGTLLMLLPVLLAMLFVAGARKRHLFTIFAIGAAAIPVFYLYFMHGYQKQRIEVVLKQNAADERWHMGPGYQLRQSKVALGTGGVWGEGFGQGVFVEHGLLPEEHNDFIFAMVGHQCGFVGGALVILAYGVIVLCGVEVATVTNDPFGRLLAVGVVVMIVAQALQNIGMTIGYFPITGITLPFVSYGGNSLWANFIALGLLVNVAQRRPMMIARKPFAYDES